MCDVTVISLTGRSTILAHSYFEKNDNPLNVYLNWIKLSLNVFAPIDRVLLIGVDRPVKLYTLLYWAHNTQVICNPMWSAIDNGEIRWAAVSHWTLSGSPPSPPPFISTPCPKFFPQVTNLLLKLIHNSSTTKKLILISLCGRDQSNQRSVKFSFPICSVFSTEGLYVSDEYPFYLSRLRPCCKLKIDA